MISSSVHFARDGVRVADVACRHRAGRGADGTADGPEIVFVRRGCFARTVDGVTTLLDPTLAFCVNAGDPQRYDHPHDSGDDCTTVRLTPSLLATIWPRGERLPSAPLRTSARTDLAHRRLLAAARRGEDADTIVEATLVLVADLLGAARGDRCDLHRAPAGARRRLVGDARELLAADPGTPLPSLARALAVSPAHLSRTFRACTGVTIARHRTRLRVRMTLDRLAEGETRLARAAADAGFADHAHMCRAVRAELGETPSRLQRALAGRVTDA